MKRTSMLQRQLRTQANLITEHHEMICNCKTDIAWLKKLSEIPSTKARVDALYNSVRKINKALDKLVELQKFTKQQLQQAYDDEHSMRWFKYAPKFMAEAPVVEMGSYSINIGD